jgi:hypothetical protein
LSRRIIFSGLKKKEDFFHHNSLHRKTHLEAMMLDMFVSAVTVKAFYSVQAETENHYRSTVQRGWDFK